LSSLTLVTEADARVLWENAILVSPAWHLSHGWHVSVAGYIVLPILKGAELDDFIGRRCQMLPLHEFYLPENAPRRGIWLPRLQRKRQEELGEFAGPYSGCYNIVGRRAWWQNRDVDDVLREHDYVPPLLARRPTPSARRRTGVLRRAPRRTHYRRDDPLGSSSRTLREEWE
jgi:hypothetical protein